MTNLINIIIKIIPIVLLIIIAFGIIDIIYIRSKIRLELKKQNDRNTFAKNSRAKNHGVDINKQVDNIRNEQINFNCYANPKEINHEA